jgi:hypothetical protein
MFRVLQRGASGYLLKPIDPPQVFFCVNEIYREGELIRRKALLQAKKPYRRARPRRPLPDEAIS